MENKSYGAKFIRWRPIEAYISDVYISGLLYLPHSEALLKKCLITRKDSSESFFPLFSFANFSIEKTKDWRITEEKVYERLPIQNLWSPGNSSSGISLSLKLQRWNNRYQSFLRRRFNHKII